MTLREDIALRGGGEGHLSVYRALVRANQKEPEDFVFMGGAVDFVMQKVPRALAVIATGETRSAVLGIRAASLGQSIHLDIVDEAEALRSSDQIASRLVRGM